MPRLKDRFPPRFSEPLTGVRDHVAKRNGMVDAAKERRRQRRIERAPFVGGGMTCRRVSGPGTTVGTGSQGSDTATCGAGEWATGGGGSSTGTGSTTTMIAQTPGDPPTSWTVGFYNDSGATDTLTAYAVCCKLG